MHPSHLSESSHPRHPIQVTCPSHPIRVILSEPPPCPSHPISTPHPSHPHQSEPPYRSHPIRVSSSESPVPSPRSRRGPLRARPASESAGPPDPTRPAHPSHPIRVIRSVWPIRVTLSELPDRNQPIRATRSEPPPSSGRIRVLSPTGGPGVQGRRRGAAPSACSIADVAPPSHPSRRKDSGAPLRRAKGRARVHLLGGGAAGGGSTSSSSRCHTHTHTHTHTHAHAHTHLQGGRSLRARGVAGLYVFVAPPDLAALRARLTARGTETGSGQI